MSSSGESRREAGLPAALASCPERVGPYRIGAPLGRGGMSTVFRAQDADGAPAAVKLSAGVDEANLVALRREIHALGRIRHPGVVRILAQGTHEDTAWFSMELLEGPTLRTRIEAARQAGSPAADRAAVRDVLELVVRLCEPLAHVHELGIVHADLKPENVHMRADGTPVLVDFGLLAHFTAATGRETLEIGGMAGTAIYMAPEQIRGELIDPRADLYALGCMLYEVATGAPPFVAATRSDIFFQHLHVDPPRPSSRAPGVPAWLDDLVLQLLCKSRRDRLGYAEVVAARLAEGLGVARRSGRGRAARTYLYRPEFVGREDESTLLTRHVEAALGGRGRFVLVGGESGIGKTRLVMEAARHAAERGMAVVLGACTAVATDGGGALGRPALEPFRPLLATVLDRCRAGGIEVTERLLGPRGPVLAAHEPALATLPGQGSYLPPPQVSPEAALDRLANAIIETVATLAAETPLLLVLDDVHWADELSMHVATRLREAVAGLPVLVFATYRDDEPTAAGRDLAGASRAATLHLSRLDAAGMRRMVGDMLALPSAPPEFVDTLFAHTEGNPFFVSEYLLVAVDERLLVRDDAGRWCLAASPAYSLPLPRTLRDLIRLRLGGLAPGPRALLEMAGVLGQSCDEAVLMHAAGVAPAEAMDAIQDLLRRRMLERDADGRLVFRHGKIREVTYDGIDPAARAERHERAARALAAQSVLRPGDHAALAHHWSRATDRCQPSDELLATAIDAVESAGEQAAHADDNTAAIALFQDALRLQDRRGGHAAADRERRARWLRRLGEAHFRLGHAAEARTTLANSLDLMGERIPSRRAALGSRLLVEACRQVAHRVLPRAAGARVGARNRARADAASAHELLGFVQLLMMERVPSLVSYLRSLNTAERSGPPAVLANSSAVVGMSVGTLLGHRFAARYFRRGLATARELRDGYCLGRVAHMLGFYLIGRGDWATAEDALAESFAAFATVGDARWRDSVVLTTGNLHYIHRRTGGLHLYETGARGSRERGDSQSQGWAALGCAAARLALGDTDGALASLETMDIALSRRLDHLADRTSEFSAHGIRAAALLRSDRIAEARRAAEDALEMAARLPLLLYYAFPGHVHTAEVSVRLWEGSLEHGSQHAARDARLAASALGNLRAYARHFPIGRPALALWSGLGHWLTGRPTRARRAWRRARIDALRLDMPFERALAYYEAGRHLPETDARRTRCLDRAVTQLEELGVAYDLALARSAVGPAAPLATFVAETIT
jgi:tetratricopeptide (TPR) repeat protein